MRRSSFIVMLIAITAASSCGPRSETIPPATVEPPVDKYCLPFNERPIKVGAIFYDSVCLTELARVVTAPNGAGEFTIAVNGQEQQVTVKELERPPGEAEYFVKIEHDAQ